MLYLNIVEETLFAYSGVYTEPPLPPLTMLVRLKGRHVSVKFTKRTKFKIFWRREVGVGNDSILRISSFNFPFKFHPKKNLGWLENKIFLKDVYSSFSCDIV